MAASTATLLRRFITLAELIQGFLTYHYKQRGDDMRERDVGSNTKLYIGVIGRWQNEDPLTLSLSEAVGQEIAKRGAILVTGGGPGVMAAACKGAKRFGGTTVGILAGFQRGAANEFVDVAIPTGLGFEVRSALVVRTSDAIVMVGGANGSLGELSIAYLYCKAMVVLRGSGGWADRLSSVLVNGQFMDERRNAPIYFAESPIECVSRAIELALRAKRSSVPRPFEEGILDG
jgi:uncharacterized protein (TIGR00725 family)